MKQRLLSFKQIGRTEELGSGVKKMMKYSEAYGGYLPKLISFNIHSIKSRDAIYRVSTSFAPQQKNFVY